MRKQSGIKKFRKFLKDGRKILLRLEVHNKFLLPHSLRPPVERLVTPKILQVKRIGVGVIETSGVFEGVEGVDLLLR